MIVCLACDGRYENFSGNPAWLDFISSDALHCCSKNNQCGYNEGTCVSDDECQDDLVCGQDNCIGERFTDSHDCCTTKDELGKW